MVERLIDFKPIELFYVHCAGRFIVQPQLLMKLDASLKLCAVIDKYWFCKLKAITFRNNYLLANLGGMYCSILIRSSLNVHGASMTQQRSLHLKIGRTF